MENYGKPISMLTDKLRYSGKLSARLTEGLELDGILLAKSFNLVKSDQNFLITKNNT